MIWLLPVCPFRTRHSFPGALAVWPNKDLHVNTSRDCLLLQKPNLPGARVPRLHPLSLMWAIISEDPSQLQNSQWDPQSLFQPHHSSIGVDSCQSPACKFPSNCLFPRELTFLQTLLTLKFHVSFIISHLRVEKMHVLDKNKPEDHFSCDSTDKIRICLLPLYFFFMDLCYSRSLFWGKHSSLNVT